VSPDIDTVIYTLAEAVNPVTGWGLAGETWHAMEELRAYGGDRLAWFNLGDHDVGTHLYRTSRMAEGAPLSSITSEIAARWGLRVRVLPMSDDRVETCLTIEEGGEEVEVGFQEYFVQRHHDVAVRSVRLAGVEHAKAAPGVLDALAGARGVVICPSNPVVSIGPVLRTGGIGEAVAARRDNVVAVSPIVAGRALKGPADRLLTELGYEASVVGVAEMWCRYAATLVIDTADGHLAGRVEQTGMRCVVAPTIMADEEGSRGLGGTVLEALVAGAGG
jgi:LPPG:FO 2-phospho-L-lactate transferase